MIRQRLAYASIAVASEIHCQLVGEHEWRQKETHENWHLHYKTPVRYNSWKVEKSRHWNPGPSFMERT